MYAGLGYIGQTFTRTVRLYRSLAYLARREHRLDVLFLVIMVIFTPLFSLYFFPFKTARHWRLDYAPISHSYILTLVHFSIFHKLFLSLPPLHVQ